MKMIIAVVSSLLFTGCISPCYRAEENNPKAQLAYVLSQTEHRQDGSNVKRIMLWAEGEWWEVFKKDLK